MGLANNRATSKHCSHVLAILLIFTVVHALPLGLPRDDKRLAGNNPFLPAPVGFRPACALPGLTFCDEASLQGTAYPIDTIEMVIDRSSPNPLLSFFGDESEGDQEPAFIASSRPATARPQKNVNKAASTSYRPTGGTKRPPRNRRSVEPGPVFRGLLSSTWKPESESVLQDDMKHVVSAVAIQDAGFL